MPWEASREFLNHAFELLRETASYLLRGAPRKPEPQPHIPYCSLRRPACEAGV